jgi:hypothetical protein
VPSSVSFLGVDLSATYGRGSPRAQALLGVPMVMALLPFTCIPALTRWGCRRPS